MFNEEKDLVGALIKEYLEVGTELRVTFWNKITDFITNVYNIKEE